MNLPSIPVILVISVLVIYFLWKLLSPRKKKPVQRRFRIRKHRKNKPGDEFDEDPGE